MEKDYIKLYKEIYDKVELSTEIEIKERFISFKEKGRSYHKAGDIISKDIYDEIQSSSILQDPLKDLYYLFVNRLDEFEVDIQMNVIPEILESRFNNINFANNYFFKDFIIDLATLNAKDNVENAFSNNRQLYFLMYRLNDFSEFCIKNCTDGVYSVMYEKYRKLLYEPIKRSEVNKLDTAEEGGGFSGLEKNNHYQIKEEYYEKFLSKEFYGYLIKDFINETKTSYSCFKDVFTEKSVKHSSEIHFFCSTILASLLLSEFQKHIFNKLVMTQIEIKHLKVNNGNRLSANNISKSKKNASESHERKVNKALLFLEEILIKPTISDNKC
jgi:hypothetical protein